MGDGMEATHPFFGTVGTAASDHLSIRCQD